MKIKMTVFALLALTFFLASPFPLLAEDPPAAATTTTPAAAEPAPEILHNPLGTDDIREVIGNVIRALLGLSGALALLMFVWGGMQWLISGGKPEMITKGKNTLIWASIGLVIIFAAYLIVNALITALVSGTFSAGG